jgi:hypothetical protein
MTKKAVQTETTAAKPDEEAKARPAKKAPAKKADAKKDEQLSKADAKGEALLVPRISKALGVPEHIVSTFVRQYAKQVKLATQEFGSVTMPGIGRMVLEK